MNPYGLDHTSAGGNSYHHFLAANIYFEMVARKDAQILNEKEEKIGHIIRATIEKNKSGVWPKNCEFSVDFTKGVVNLEQEIGQLAINYDIVLRPTTMSYTYGDHKWVGASKFNEALKENPALCNELLQKVEAARDAKYFKKSSAVISELSEKIDKPSKLKKS